MANGQSQKSGQGRDQEPDTGEAQVEEANAKVDESKDLLDNVDDLLDEIDDVLEENAEEFVKNYVQKGGQ